jgi:hypothetical protein
VPSRVGLIVFRDPGARPARSEVTGTVQSAGCRPTLAKKLGMRRAERVRLGRAKRIRVAGRYREDGRAVAG